MPHPAASAILTLAGIVGLATTCHADELADLNRLIGEFDADNPGKEMLVDFREARDTDLDEIADLIRMRFDVYPLGSTTRLYSSQLQSFSINFPTWLSVCDLEDFAGRQPGTRVVRAGSRVVLVSGYSLRCSNTAELFQHHRTFVYGATVTTAGGASWRFQADGELESAAGIDSNTDGRVDQVVVEMRIEAPSGSNARVVVLDAATGALVSSTVHPSIR